MPSGVTGMTHPLTFLLSYILRTPGGPRQRRPHWGTVHVRGHGPLRVPRDPDPRGQQHQSLPGGQPLERNTAPLHR